MKGVGFNAQLGGTQCEGTYLEFEQSTKKWIGSIQ